MKKDWTSYYEKTNGRPRTKLLAYTINNFMSDLKDIKAIDIGCGDMVDTKYMLSLGFDVTSIDSSEGVLDQAKNLGIENSNIIITKIEDFDFGIEQYNLVCSMLTLPFINPSFFEASFEKIKKSITKQGIVCCQFFGKNDDWSDNKYMTFHTKDDIEKLLEDFEILTFEEIEKDVYTAFGNKKHSHLFNVIARKK